MCFNIIIVVVNILSLYDNPIINKFKKIKQIIYFRVTERSKDNCMDSKNLAICWWPTLLQYEFGDLSKFEAMRPHLEDIVQTMIDQFRFLFCGQEEIMMV